MFVDDLVREAYQYAIWRIVPDLVRGESLNGGVVLYCKRKRFLGARVYLDEKRLAILAPGIDPGPFRNHLELRRAIAAGEKQAGALAGLPDSPRFGWLVSPSSTCIQSSEVHTGLCEDPERELEHLFRRLVLLE